MAAPDQLPAVIPPGVLILTTPTDTYIVPALVADLGEDAAWHYVEFFSANISNPNTRRAYARACARFFAWCETRNAKIREERAGGKPEQQELTPATVRSHDVASFIEWLHKMGHSAPSIKQQLAAIRMLFNWLVVGQVVPVNPAAAVRGPKHVVTTGKTPVLEGGEWRKLIDTIPTDTVRDLRDRALIATLTYSFARIGAALEMKVEDLRPKGASWELLLHEKGGKEHKMPCHHVLAEMLHAYIAAAGIAEDRKGSLFRTARGHNATALSIKPMAQQDALRMVHRRVAAAGIAAKIGNHSFRATGLTAYLENGGVLEHAQEMAAHASPRTTKLYRSNERTAHASRGRENPAVKSPARGSASRAPPEYFSKEIDARARMLEIKRARLANPSKDRLKQSEIEKIRL